MESVVDDWNSEEVSFWFQENGFRQYSNYTDIFQLSGKILRHLSATSLSMMRISDQYHSKILKLLSEVNESNKAESMSEEPGTY